MKKKNKENVKQIKDIFKKNFEVKYFIDGAGTDFGMCWMHKDDDHYLCHDIDDIIYNNYNFLLKYKINDLISHSLGKSDDGKYYGWSHRAIYGFEIGDKVKKGDSNYYPDNKENFEESMLDWVSHDVGVDDEYGTNCIIKSITKDTPNPDGYYTYSENGVEVTAQPCIPVDPLPEENPIETDPKTVQIEEIYHDPDPKILGINIITRTDFFGKQEGREAYNRNHWYEYPETYGKGTYTINTDEEAKQAAMDFASSVS